MKKIKSNKCYLKVFNKKIALVYSDEAVAVNDNYLTGEGKILRCRQIMGGLVYGERDHGRPQHSIKKIVLLPNQIGAEMLELVAKGELKTGDEIRFAEEETNMTTVV